MKVLLTGGTGYIGSHTVRALVAAGHRPRLLVRDSGRLHARAAALGVDSDALEVVTGDMTDTAAVAEAASGCGAAIHAAAAVAVFNKADAERTVEINVTGTRNVLEAALAAGCDPVVHVSSITVFGTHGPRVITADLPPATRVASPYARAKVRTEELARRHQESGEPVVITYPTGVTGPAVGDAYGELAMGFVSMLKSGCLVTHSGGVAIVDVRDVADALAATVVPGQGPRRYIIGGRFLTLPELGAVIRELTGRSFPVLPVPGAVLRGLGHVSDAVRRIAPFDTVFTAEAMAALTLARPSDDGRLRDELGVSYRDVAETVEASLRALHAGGMLSARQVGRLATGTA